MTWKLFEGRVIFFKGHFIIDCGGDRIKKKDKSVLNRIESSYTYDLKKISR
jgi:hypothetical protein